jgi:riboflavin-specific deaminase-like protein
VKAADPPARAADSVRLRAVTSPDHWLEVDATGSWRASGPVSEGARDLLDLYLPLRLDPDIVIGQLGQSLDGRIATEGGASQFVTGPEDIERLHRLRALVDAVIVGAGTVAADDPRLTVREVEGRNPVRVVLDPSGRLERDRRVFLDGAARTLLVHRAEAGEGHAEATATAPSQRDLLDVIRVGSLEVGGLDLVALLAELRSRGLSRVLVEGGGVTVSRFLQAGLLDRLHVTVAPLVIGSGRPSLTLDPIESLDLALRPPCRHFRLGDDVLFDLDLRGGRPGRAR